MNPFARVRQWYARAWNATHRPESVLNRTWDNLLLLDACRYDIFRQVAPAVLSDELIGSRTTLGSSTPEFLSRTFGDKQHHDIVYVTANPQPIRFAHEAARPPWHTLISVLGAWDYETQTVPPTATAEAARKAADEYPDKRLIVHFLQPHAPFIGTTANHIREQFGLAIRGVDPGREYTEWNPQNIETTRYREAVTAGVDPQLIRAAYAETLYRVLDTAVSLADDLDGRTVVTADHGERLGERSLRIGPRRWEHPSHATGRRLRTVPWVVLTDGPRRRIETAAPEKSPTATQNTERQLRALGYG